MTKQRHFQQYLKEMSGQEFDPDGEYFVGSADCFFPVAARALLKDGIDPDTLVHILVSSAHEMMIRDNGMSYVAASDKLLKAATDIATMLDDPQH